MTPEEKLQRKKDSSKKYRETHKNKIKEYNKLPTTINNRQNNRNKLKKQAYEIISNYHNSEIKCWRCGESLIEALTIGHINNDGKQDRLVHGTGETFFRKIISGIRSCENLKIECFNCNCCLENYGKYPDEITEEEFLL